MSSLAHNLAPGPIAIGTTSRTYADACVTLRLLPSGDGWSLIGSDGRLVFKALGPRGRRRCLEFARAHGVLALFS